MALLFPPPSGGDIVWCRFPYRGIAGPGQKPRPALIVDVGHLRGEPAAQVAYGTSQKMNRIYSSEFIITPDDEYAFEASGLALPTKFDVAHLVFLPYNDYWFAVPPGAPHGQIPKLGILHPSLVRRAKAAYDSARRH